MPDTQDPYGPSRPLATHRRDGKGSLTSAQLALADDLHTRALALRAASDGDLSIREAVHLAAVQLGLETPQPEGDNQ